MQWIELADGNLLAIPENASILRDVEEDGTTNVTLYATDGAPYQIFREKDPDRAKALWLRLKSQLRTGKGLITPP